ncbi:hypothetical protein [uncultured Duncaniella sp.]|uniref:hypothetical protein n=1 Tax=uncultured Duncaniella sp. TaxID=2768039 RepID=UPI0025B1377C|nr:hypothetical protein [uncultured Duncaniella sp.]
MKLTINFSDFQLMKAIALSPATEEQADKIMAAVRETPELDITEFLSSDKDSQQVALLIAVSAIAAISEKYKIE